MTLGNESVGVRDELEMVMTTGQEHEERERPPHAPEPKHEPGNPDLDPDVDPDLDPDRDPNVNPDLPPREQELDDDPEGQQPEEA